MNNETLETTLKDNNIIETELSDSKVLETEIMAIQKSIETDHSKLENLDYEHSGHTGFQPAGNYIEDTNYVHTDNNYTTEEKAKLSNLENYDDTEIKRDIQSLEDTKVDREVNKGLSTNDYTNEEKTKLASLENYDDTEVKSDITNLQNNKQNKIDSNNKLNSDLVDDTNNTNKFVTSNEKTTWNNKSDFSGNYNDLTNKPTIPDELKDLSDDSTHRLVTDTEKTTWNSKSDFSGDYNDLSNKPTIPVVPTNVSAFTNDAGYLTSETDPVFSNSASAGITSSDITNWNGKQEALVSGTNIKTINNTSILGSGNIDVGGGSSEIPTITENTKIYELDNGIYLLNGGGYYIYFGNSTTHYVQNAYGYLFVTDSPINNRKQFQMILSSCSYKIPNAGSGSTTKVIVSGVSYSTSTSGSDVTKTHYSALVNTSTDEQTISKKKTFTTLPESSVTPTTNNQLTNKSYVDSAITSAIGTALGGSY